MGTLGQSVAAIAGDADGCGRAIAEAFVREGAQVAVGGMDAPAGGDSIRFAGADGARATHEGLVDCAVESFGRLDVLVLAAGEPRDATALVDLTDEDWRRIVEGRLGGVFWAMRRALAHMIPREQGRILVVSSITAKLPEAGATAAVAAEHGVSGLVKSVAREVGPLGITVNAIVPGPLAGSGDPPLPPQLGHSKLGRPTSADEVASVALLLASPAMTSISGCLFPVDGGAMPY